MILCDPFAINTLSLSTVRHLQELVGQELLPRVSAPGWPHAAFWGTCGCGPLAPGSKPALGRAHTPARWRARAARTLG